MNILTPPERLQTDRLVLRRVAATDAEEIFQEYAADEEVTRYLTWQPYTAETAPALKNFLTNLIRQWEDGSEFAWVLTLSGEDRAIGMLSARILGHKLGLGYVLGRRHWKRGYMSEAVLAVANWAFLQDTIYRIGATCDIENIASTRVLEKCGFEREGILRGWINHPNVSDDPRDSFSYSLVRNVMPALPVIDNPAAVARSNVESSQTRTSTMSEKTSGQLLYCSFCGKDQHSIAKLIAGPSVFICNECIDSCSESTPADLSADDQCSFCAKPNSSVKQLYAGPTTRICNECLTLCLNIIAEEDTSVDRD